MFLQRGLVRWTPDGDSLYKASPSAELKLARMLRSIADLLECSEHLTEGLSVREKGVDEIRKLCARIPYQQGKPSLIPFVSHFLDPSLHSESLLAELARHLSNYAISLGKVGHHSKGFVAHQEAVILGRQLFQANPKLRRAEFAKYLTLFGASLDASGRHDEARSAKQEASGL